MLFETVFSKLKKYLKPYFKLFHPSLSVGCESWETVWPWPGTCPQGRDVQHNPPISEVFSGWNISTWAFWFLQAIRTFSSEINSRKKYSNKAQGGKGRTISWGGTNSPGQQHNSARGGSSAQNSLLLQLSLSNSVTTNYHPSTQLPLSTVLGPYPRSRGTARARHQLQRSADPADW